MRNLGLSVEELKEYQENGFVGLERQLLPPEDFNKVRQLGFSVYDKANSSFISVTGAHYYEPELLAWATRPELLDVVEQILGPDIGLFSTTLFYKKPHSTASVDWHRDSEYLRTYEVFSSIELASLLLALTDSHHTNGCVEYVAGSHVEPHLRDFKIDHAAERMFTSAQQQGDYTLTPAELSRKKSVVMQAGQFSLHDIHTLHGSSPNRSDQSRVLLNFKFFPTRLRADRARLLKKFNIEQDLYLVRGRDISGSCNISLV